MNEMIKIDFSGEQMKVSARDLHERLGINTQYNKWFSRMCEYGFTEGTDFWTFLTESTGGRPASDAIITVGMAKEICMLTRNEIGSSMRKYFIKVEEDWNSPDKVMARALKMADATIAKLTAQIEADKPKTVFYDAISASANSISFGAMAKLAHNNGYDIGRNRFIDLLIKHGYVMRDNRNLVPTQRAINLGVLEPKESYYGDNKTGIRITCVVTGKGQVYFMDFLYKLFNGQLGA